MTNDVVITVIGSQDDGDITLTTCGNYYKKAEKHYVFYEEQADADSDIVKDRICFDTKRFEMTKKGAVNSKMIFALDETTCSYYQTPFGPIDIDIITQNYTVEETDEKISITIDYTLSMNKQEASDCHVSVVIEAK